MADESNQVCLIRETWKTCNVGGPPGQVWEQWQYLFAWPSLCHLQDWKWQTSNHLWIKHVHEVA